MNLPRFRFLLLGIALLQGSMALTPVHAATESPVELIEFQQVPLTSALESLARQAGGNFILDPRLPESPVTVRWEQLSARAALERLVREHRLFLVTNTATGVTRISATNRIVPRVDAQWIAADTNAPIPLLHMLEAPLEFALQELARQGGLNLVLDTKSPPPSFAPGEDFEPPRSMFVSFRWEELKPRQAIAALCENYSLTLTAETNTGTVRVAPAERQPAHRGQRPERP